jgi:hypothetical protein
MAEFRRSDHRVKVLYVEQREFTDRKSGDTTPFVVVHYQEDGGVPASAASFDAEVGKRLAALAPGAEAVLGIDETITRRTVRAVTPTAK